MREGYKRYDLILSRYQAKKIKKAIDEGRSEVTLRPGPNNITKGGFKAEKELIDKLSGATKIIPITLNKIEKKEGILPLAALIPIIASVIAGTTGAAGGIATTVAKAREAKVAEASTIANEKTAELADIKLKKEKAGTGFRKKMSMQKGYGINDHLINMTGGTTVKELENSAKGL